MDMFADERGVESEGEGGGGEEEEGSQTEARRRRDRLEREEFVRKCRVSGLILCETAVAVIVGGVAVEVVVQL